MTSLNSAQLEILKMFSLSLSDKELSELKQVLSDFLYHRLVEEADRAFDEKGYTQDDIEKWKTLDTRKRSTNGQ